MKRKVFAILLVVMLVSVSACSNSTSTDSSQTANQKTEQQEDKNNADQKDENKEEQSGENSDEKSQNTVSNEDKSVEIKVYMSNDDATAFVSESVEIAELTPENIVNALIEKSVLSSDVQVLKCDKQTVEGVESLEVDFNEAFGVYVSSKGTTGEYYTIGSIVNTFLDAYGCEKIKITVEGNTLETGHNDYPGYMDYTDRQYRHLSVSCSIH